MSKITGPGTGGKPTTANPLPPLPAPIAPSTQPGPAWMPNGPSPTVKPTPPPASQPPRPAGGDK
jgi:hypothetical protein